MIFLIFFISPAASQENSSNRFNLGPSLEEDTAPQAPPVSERPFEFDLKTWDQMRKVREGQAPAEVEVSTTAVEVSTATIEPPKPPPGQISFELPYESSLSVTGRKLIKVELQNKHITQERAEETRIDQDTQSFNMEQELQANIQGTVARKTTINVNFDDTKENVRDFSVIYKGDPDEVVQEAAFGDITLTLPSTEFVNYQKQLFGIRTALKYKRAGLMAIGSRTKGTTETKRFTGTTTRRQVFVNDTQYLRRKFYDLTLTTANAKLIENSQPPFFTDPLPLNDSIPEIVFIEDKTTNPNAQDYVISSPTDTTLEFTIRMRQLFRGVDYSIDRQRGILTFTNPINEDVRIAINYAIKGGAEIKNLTPQPNDVAILIKDLTPEGSNVSQEIKRFYSAQARNIVRDNGAGNFTLKLQDKNRENDIGADPDGPLGNAPPVLYPDTIEMNFETGIFEVEQLLPFPDVYAPNVNTGAPVNAVFALEYNSILRTYTLRPNIVLQSEKVDVDGRRLNRDLDYFIDYDIGIVTFFNDDLIRESTVIEMTYEFAPFGGQLGETLVGARGTYDIFTNQSVGGVAFENWSVGSTVLYNFAAKPTSPPDIRSTPSSLLVTEADTNIIGLQFGELPIKFDLKAEAAQSKENPNLFGKALVDSMEGIKQEDSAPMLRDSWQVSAPPETSGYNAVVDFRGREDGNSHITWAEGDVATTDPNDDDATQKALNVGFKLNTESTAMSEQVSFVNVLSFAGRDFSKKSAIEVELAGAGSNGADVELLVEYGTFSEDADDDNVLDSEDTIPLDNILNLGEDTGFLFNGPGPDLLVGTSGDNIPVRIGAGNTRLDSEDFNNDRVLNVTDRPATTNPLFEISQANPKMAEGENTLTQDLSFSGRKIFKFPIDLNALSEEEKARLLAVRQLRVTIRNRPTVTAAKTGVIQLVKIAAVGNTWEPGVTTTGSDVMTVVAINNKDDSRYVSLIGNPDFNNLYKGSTPDADAREQALAISYSLLSNSSGTTKNVFGSPRDLSQHDTLKFFVRKSSPDVSCAGSDCGIFYFQAGSETDYQEVAINVSAIPNDRWQLITIDQRDANGDGTPETWIPLTPGITVSRVGANANLTQITQLKIAIQNLSGATVSNQIWVNEIHLDDPHERVGNARSYTFDSSWTNWMDFGGKYSKVDRNFQTPTTAITNRDDIQSSGYLKFNRLAMMPMTFDTTRSEKVTPSAFRSNNNALVSFLEEGREVSTTNRATASLLLPKMPVFNFSYDNNSQENTNTQRDETNDIWRVGATYSPTVKPDMLPGAKLTFRPLPTSITLNYGTSIKKVRYGELNKLLDFGISTAPFTSTDLTQFKDESEVRLAFKPWDNFTFNPNYKLAVEKEKRSFREDEVGALPELTFLNDTRTPRAISQNLSANGQIKLLKWLNPNYSYSLDGTETNDQPKVTNTTSYLLKTITRSGRANANATLSFNQILPKFALFQSLSITPRYELERGDTYKDVPNNLKWRDKLWVTDEIDVSSGTGARRESSTSAKKFNANTSWLPFSGYRINKPRYKPLGTLNLTNNYSTTIEDTETTGTKTHKEIKIFPDLIVNISDSEDFFGSPKWLDDSRLTLKTTTNKSETASITKSRSDTHGVDYIFKLLKKFDIATTLNLSRTREDNLVTNQLTSLTDVKGYSVQAGFPWKTVWRFTPRYERSERDSRDSLKQTDDLVNEIYSLLINGDLDKPLGIRFGRREYGLTNRFIVNSTVKWDKKRSNIKPETGYLDTYSFTLTGDYTISKNFRLAVGGDFSQEVHHPDFKKLDQTIFSVNSTLTIQF